MAAKKRIAHYVASTHWDREWYESFQDYRFRLVDLLDEVLDTMRDNPEFRYFQMDGQAIPIEDYLEVRPERAEQLREMAAGGRLRIGPWYVLPDEFLVSGESIVRNLQLGLEVSKQYGPPSRAGFVCDLFGHTSQLPQIFRGFGLDVAFLWRGVNESTHGALFRWQAPDGSEVLSYRFSYQGGYCTYAFKVRHALEVDKPFDLQAAQAGMKTLLEDEGKRCPTSSLMLFDGGDHLEIEPQTTELLKLVNRKSAGFEIVHSHLDGFAEDLREQREHITRVFKGELRDPGEQGDHGWLIPGVLSSRIQLKQANARCENELTLWAEPFSVFAARTGRAYPFQYLKLAWKHLITNHPHDSICGCSIDQVHKDMVYRFDQSYLIASHVKRDALQHIARQVELPETGEKDLALVVFNPTCEPVHGPVDVTVRFPAGTDAIYQEFFGFERKVGFRLFDAGGKEVPYQYVSQRREQVGFRRPHRKFPVPEQRHEVDITAELTVPPYGYTTLVCRPVAEPTRYLGSMAVDDHTIENEILRVAVNSNGTLQVLDKRSGRSFTNLLTLEDQADIGDGWYHGTAVNEQVHTSVASCADVALTADGIGKATLSIRVTMNIPRRFEFDAMVRSEELQPLVVIHQVTLRKGRDRVEVHTSVHNHVRDHRLRVLFPSGAAKAMTYLADQAFDVVERPIALRPDNARYKELEVETRSQYSWTGVSDGRQGLAVISTGLPESAVRDLPDRPIALTLLRAFVKAVFTGGNEGGQIQGRHEFDYWIVPLQGRPDVTQLTRLGQQLAGGLETVQLDHRDLAARPASTLPMAQSFVQLESDAAVVSAIHRTSEAHQAAIRLFNPTDRQLDAPLVVPGVGSTARATDLEGKPLDALPREAHRVTVPVAPRKIVTVELA